MFTPYNNLFLLTSSSLATSTLTYLYIYKIRPQVLLLAPQNLFLYTQILPFILVPSLLQDNQPSRFKHFPSLPFQFKAFQMQLASLGANDTSWFSLCAFHLEEPRTSHLIILRHGSDIQILCKNTICIKKCYLPDLSLCSWIPTSSRKRQWRTSAPQPLVPCPRTCGSLCFPCPFWRCYLFSCGSGVGSSREV